MAPLKSQWLLSSIIQKPLVRRPRMRIPALEAKGSRSCACTRHDGMAMSVADEAKHGTRPPIVSIAFDRPMPNFKTHQSINQIDQIWPANPSNSIDSIDLHANPYSEARP